jgi:hypothetical protein
VKQIDEAVDRIRRRAAMYAGQRGLVVEVLGPVELLDQLEAGLAAALTQVTCVRLADDAATRERVRSLDNRRDAVLRAGVVVVLMATSRALLRLVLQHAIDLTTASDLVIDLGVEEEEVEEPVRYDYFLAYPAGAKKEAHELATLLRARGVRVFLDDQDLAPGEWRDLPLNRPQRASAATVVLLSPDAGRSAFLGAEVANAVRMARLGGHGVVSVWLGEPTATMPYGLADFAALTARDGLSDVAARLADAAGAPAFAVTYTALVEHQDREALVQALARLAPDAFDAVLRALPPDVAVGVPPRGTQRDRVEALVGAAAVDDRLERGLIEVLERSGLDADALPSRVAARRWLARESAVHSAVPLFGLAGEAESVDLDAAYVPLELRSRTGAGAFLPLSAALRDVSFRRGLGRKIAGIALIGPAGSGKTVGLRWLYTSVAEGRAAEVGLPEGLRPVSLRLGQVWRSMTGEDGPRATLAELVEAESVRAGFSGAGRTLMSVEQPLLVLLDGLDEVPDAAHRLAVARWFDIERRRWPGSWFVVTSRPESWPEHAFPSLVAYDLAPLDDAAIVAFVRRSFSDEVADGVLAAVYSDAGLRSLARNPLHLTLLARIVQDHGALPTDRVALVTSLLVAQLETWSIHQGRARALPVEPLLDALAMLAWRLREEQPPDGLPIDTLRSALDGLGRPDAVEIVEDAGVVVTAAGRWTFQLLVYEEVLAVRHLVRAGLTEELARRLGDPGWRHTAILAAGHAGFLPELVAAAQRVGLDVAGREVLVACAATAPEADRAAVAALGEGPDDSAPG